MRRKSHLKRKGPKLDWRTEKEAIEFLENHLTDLFTGSFTNERVDPPFQIGPKDFFKMANEDLRTRGRHALVNAIGNIKRCIECQIDLLLYVYGFGDVSTKQNWNFIRRLDTLKGLKIVAPRILERINRRRNMLEHQYRLPNRAEVEDSLDVAALFLAYTDLFLDKVLNPMCLVLMPSFDEIVEFTINRRKGTLTIKILDSGIKFVIGSGQPEYLRALAIALLVART